MGTKDSETKGRERIADAIVADVISAPRLDDRSTIAKTIRRARTVRRAAFHALEVGGTIDDARAAAAEALADLDAPRA